MNRVRDMTIESFMPLVRLLAAQAGEEFRPMTVVHFV
jgi:hypothetical protein